MRNLLKTIFAALIMTAVMFSGCKKADPPTVNFIAEVDGYEVTFTVEATGEDTYAWDYGDGTTSTTAGGHAYTYAESGDFTVKLVVTGEGGTAEKSVDVEVLPGMMELLTGGPSATNGKTWKMSTNASLGIDGASNIVPPNFSTWIDAMGNVPFPNNVLNIVGYTGEYDNTYTFYHNGTMDIDPVNTDIIAGAVYANIMAAQSLETITNAAGANYGLVLVAQTAVTGKTFTLNNGDFSLDIATEVTGSADVLSTVNITGVDYLEFTDGGFIGLKDFETKTLIRSVTYDRLVITVFMRGSANSILLPTLALTVSFDVVP